MANPESHTLLVLPRGRRGQIRLTRERLDGHPFTKLQPWFPAGDEGELRPGRSISIRDHELDDVLRALTRVQRARDRGGQPRGPTRAARRLTAQELDEQGVF